MRSGLVLGVAASFCIGVTSATPANAVTYLYEINAYYGSQPPSSTNTVIGSFTLDSSIGPASISNVNIQATLPVVGGSFGFNFDQVLEPDVTWNGGLLWFANQAFGAGDTHFYMYFHYDSSLNDGSYLIGQQLSGNFNQSEISVIGVNDWQGMEGRMTQEVAPAVTPLPPTWSMMLIGIVGFGFAAYRQKSKPALIA
jgi:hypothetical protein